jgi:hypothetical protein
MPRNRKSDYDLALLGIALLGYKITIDPKSIRTSKIDLHFENENRSALLESICTLKIVLRQVICSQNFPVDINWSKRYNARTQGENDMATMGEMVEAVKTYALSHYEKDGWDFCVECWSDTEILEMIGNGRCTSNMEAIKEVRKTCRALNEQRQEARSAGGEY